MPRPGPQSPASSIIASQSQSPRPQSPGQFARRSGSVDSAIPFSPSQAPSRQNRNPQSAGITPPRPMSTPPRRASPLQQTADLLKSLEGDLHPVAYANFSNDLARLSGGYNPLHPAVQSALKFGLESYMARVLFLGNAVIPTDMAANGQLGGAPWFCRCCSCV